jgi:transposase-like protein
MPEQAALGLLEFQAKFSSEEACRAHLYQMRWAEGFVCPKCGAKDEAFQIVSRHLYQCKHCTHQASVTAGTVMDRTRVPLRKWFWAMFLMSHDKRGCSAAQLARELQLAYGTAWLLSHKIRSAMGERDTQYVLDGYVEVDDAFFGGASDSKQPGRGTDKTLVLVGLSLDEKQRPAFVKMQCVPNMKSENIKAFAQVNFSKDAIVATDGYTSYKPLAKLYKHIGKSRDERHLKWLHIVISNAKSFIQGTYHGLDALHLQAYLNEFCFRFNRRAFSHQGFDRALCACICAHKFTYYDLAG